MSDLTSIKNMLENQRSLVFSGIEHHYGDVNHLGFHYSLMDANFYDTNRHYPDQSNRWLSENKIIKKSDLLSDYWTESELVELSEQMESGKVAYKNYHWSSVSLAYMNRHHDGLIYLDKTSFQFYLLAWIKNYMAQYLNDKISSSFFRFYLNGSYGRMDVWAELGEEKKNVIVDFLILLVMMGREDHFIVLESLKTYWLLGDGYGAETLKLYEQEKQIQDFIDKG